MLLLRKLQVLLRKVSLAFFPLQLTVLEFSLTRDRFRGTPLLQRTHLDECLKCTHLGIHLQMQFKVVQLLLLGLPQLWHESFRALLEVGAVNSYFLDFKLKFGDKRLKLKFSVALFTVLNYSVQVAFHHVAELKFKSRRLDTAWRLHAAVKLLTADVVLLVRIWESAAVLRYVPRGLIWLVFFIFRVFFGNDQLFVFVSSASWVRYLIAAYRGFWMHFKLNNLLLLELFIQLLDLIRQLNIFIEQDVDVLAESMEV